MTMQKKWEYMTPMFERDHMQDNLNQLGELGWELIGHEFDGIEPALPRYRFFLKRELKEE